MDRICLVAVGPSILGIMKSIKIASNNDEHDDEVLSFQTLKVLPLLVLTWLESVGYLQ